MKYNILCQVSGGQTGRRESLLKVMDKLYETDDKVAAEQKAAECRARVDTGRVGFGPFYSYCVVESRTND